MIIKDCECGKRCMAGMDKCASCLALDRKAAKVKASDNNAPINKMSAKIQRSVTAYYAEEMVNYEQFLSSAISKAKEFEDQDAIRILLLKVLNWNPHHLEYSFDEGVVYTIPPTEVELVKQGLFEIAKNHDRVVARILPKKEEDQEEDWLGGPEPKDIKQLENTINQLREEKRYFCNVP